MSASWGKGRLSSPTSGCCPRPLQALQEQKRDLMKVAFDRRKPEEVREMRINDVRLLMDL